MKKTEKRGTMPNNDCKKVQKESIVKSNLLNNLNQNCSKQKNSSTIIYCTTIICYTALNFLTLN